MIDVSDSADEEIVCGQLDDDIAIDSHWDAGSRVEELISHHDFLLSFVNSKLPSGLRRHLAASDVVQSVLLIVNNKHSTFRGNSEAEFRAWIFQIARRKIIDGVRRYRSHYVRQSDEAILPHELAVEDETPSECSSLNEDAEILMSAINSLPVNIREIITLRYTQCLTFEQISTQLNLPVTTCRREWLRGCEELKQRLVRFFP